MSSSMLAKTTLFVVIPNEQTRRKIITGLAPIFSCVEFNDIASVTDALEEHNSDLILCHHSLVDEQQSAVLSELKKLKPDLRVLVVGDGPSRESLLDQLKNNEIQYKYAGFVGQDALPHLYSNAKLFLFPSVNDAWGVVANEACAAGTPVITCESVGAAGELLLDSVNSFILPLNERIWAQKALGIISDTTIWDDLSNACKLQVSEYSYMNAGKGLIDAVEFSSN